MTTFLAVFAVSATLTVHLLQDDSSRESVATIQNAGRVLLAAPKLEPSLAVALPAPEGVSTEKDQPKATIPKGTGAQIAAYMPPAPSPNPLSLLNRDLVTYYSLAPDPVPFETAFSDPWLDQTKPLPTMMYSEWLEENRISMAEEIANLIFSVPELLVDGTVDVLRSISTSGNERVVRIGENEDNSLTSRLLDIEQTRPRLRRPFVSFFNRLLEEEGEFFGQFSSTTVGTPAYEQGLEDVDMAELENEQVKVIWDAAKATYLKKYKMRGAERIQSHDMYFRQWRGVDFVVMPSLLFGYSYYRGMEKRMRMGPTKLRIHLEPLKRLRSALDKEGTNSALIGADLSVYDLPVRVIVSAGVHEGDFEMDFVGIGTDFQQVRQMLSFSEE